MMNLINRGNDHRIALMKTILVFLTYLLYSYVFTKFALLFNVSDSIVVDFIGDIFFLMFVLLLYKDKIEKDKDIYHKSTSLKGRIFKVACWIILIAAGNVLGGLLITLITGTANTSIANNVAVISLPYIYKLFKTLIFSSIAEEIVVKQSIRDVIDNNLLFLIVSTLIYSSMNIAYTNLSGLALIVNAIPYAVFAIVTGVLYIKNKDNIYLVMVVKIFYTLIPLVLMLVGVGI